MKNLKLAAVLSSLILFSSNTFASGEHSGGHDDNQSTTEHGEKKMKHADGEMHHGKGMMKHGDGEMHHGKEKMKHADGEMHHGKGVMKHADGEMHHGKGMMKHADGEMHHGKEKMKHGDGEVHHGTGHWMAPSAEASNKNPVDSSSRSIAQGKMLYGQYCSSCHGPDAEGDGPAASALNPKPTNLKMMSGHHPDGDFAWKIKNGRGAMPAWNKTFNDTQVWHLVNYIQSLK